MFPVALVMHTLHPMSKQEGGYWVRREMYTLSVGQAQAQADMNVESSVILITRSH